MRWRTLRPHLRRSRAGDHDAQDSPGDRDGEEDALTAARHQMVRQQIQARGIRDPELLRAMRTVPRHRFVDTGGAYADRALPVGSGQTISQPYIVASMTNSARPPTGYAGANVLEVGTGSGYQAALLAELGARVTSIERHPELSDEARRRLADAGYRNLRLVVGDGTRGWPEGAPYDSIIVTAAGPRPPEPLVEQLKPEGGKLVMPIGTREHQLMTVVERHGDEIEKHEFEPCVFVPLLGEFGFGRDD